MNNYVNPVKNTTGNYEKLCKPSKKYNWSTEEKQWNCENNLDITSVKQNFDSSNGYDIEPTNVAQINRIFRNLNTTKPAGLDKILVKIVQQILSMLT